jgi:hypothetical protein
MTISNEVKAQVIRFVRVFALTFLPLLVAFNGRYVAGAVVAAAVSAAEVAFRAVQPVVQVKALEAVATEARAGVVPEELPPQPEPRIARDGTPMQTQPTQEVFEG